MNETIKLTYYAKIKPHEEGYLVTFRDFDNIFTEGDNIEEALHNAREALDGVLIQMHEDKHDIPLPSDSRKNEYPIPVSPEIAAPILLHMLRTKQSQTLSNVAKKMNIPYQQYQRLEHNCNMTLKSLKKAAIAMGGRIEIKLYLNEHSKLHPENLIKQAQRLRQKTKSFNFMQRTIQSAKEHGKP